jgi:hypothetical protein
MSADEHVRRDLAWRPARSGARRALVATTSLALALGLALSPLGQASARAGAGTDEAAMVALPESPTGLSLAWALPGYPSAARCVGSSAPWSSPPCPPRY